MFSDSLLCSNIWKRVIGNLGVAEEEDEGRGIKKKFIRKSSAF